MQGYRTMMYKTMMQGVQNYVAGNTKYDAGGTKLMQGVQNYDAVVRSYDVQNYDAGGIKLIYKTTMQGVQNYKIMMQGFTRLMYVIELCMMHGGTTYNAGVAKLAKLIQGLQYYDAGVTKLNMILGVTNLMQVVTKSTNYAMVYDAGG